MSDAARPEFAVEARDVVKTFDNGIVRALNGATFTIRRGEFVAVTGPSGCGKSTLLHLLAALDRPSSGTIAVNGRKLGHVRHLDRFRRDEVGLVFQLHNLLPQLSAAQNIEVAMLGTGQHRRARRQRAAALLEAIGMTDKAHARPPKLSGGERQRIAFARALANRPSLILADEPTGSLDSAGVENVLGLLGTLRDERSVTVVMVTHDLHVAAAADRTITMIDGRIVDAGVTDAVLAAGIH
jgi:putative ABC transport system ATP-binding protein